jgi:phospholipid/cholesterol/gamma-HCH transport system substrate-binding protein
MGVRKIFLGDGREPDSDTLFARGVIFVAVIAVIVVSLIAIGRGAFSDRVEAVAELDSAGGSLVKNADVKYDGLVVGRVSSLKKGNGDDTNPGVALKLFIDGDKADDIPKNVKARVVPASIFGTSYVDLVAPKKAQGKLTGGTRIQQDTSTETLELQTVLDGLDRVVDALGPAELSSMLEGLASALDGKGEQIGQTMQQLDSYLGKLNPSLPLVTENLSLLAGNLETFEKYAPDLFEATDNALVAARTLIRNEDNFHKLVGSGSQVLTTTTSLLNTNEKALVDTLMHTAIVVDALHDGRKGLVRGVLEVGQLARNFTSVIQNGAMLRVDGTVKLSGRPANYGPGQCPNYDGVPGRGC